MKFSYYLNPQPNNDNNRNFINELLLQVVLAEKLQFSDVWLTEHHFTGYNVYSDPIILASAITQRAPLLNIGFSVNVAPFHHPIRFVTQMNLLDQLTQGKITVGIGPGNSADEFNGYGLNVKDRHDIMHEFIKIALQAWEAKEGFEYSGKYYNGKVQGRIIPTSIQKPFPKIAIASTTPERLEWIGSNGWSILLGPQSPEVVASRIKYFMDGMTKANLSENKKLIAWNNTSVLRQIYVTQNSKNWETEINQEIHNYIVKSSLANTGEGDLPKSHYETRKQAYIEGGWLIAGTPEQVYEKLVPFAEMGLANLLCWFNFGGMNHKKVSDSMQLFSKHIMPELSKIKLKKGIIEKITSKKIILNKGLQRIP